jgi:hypothetical protein
MGAGKDAAFGMTISLKFSHQHNVLGPLRGRRRLALHGVWVSLEQLEAELAEAERAGYARARLALESLE